MNINKKTLVKEVAQELDLTQTETEVVVNTIIDKIREHLVNGDNVELYGFGKFEVVTRAARTAVNPATKETIQLSEAKRVKFKVSKPLKEAVNHD